MKVLHIMKMKSSNELWDFFEKNKELNVLLITI